MSPQRIQRKRTKGWRMPEGAIYVGRPSKWGNPFKAGVGEGWVGHWQAMTAEHAVALYAELMQFVHPKIRAELGGHDLACWCPLDQPCHADVLLEIANQP